MACSELKVSSAAVKVEALKGEDEFYNRTQQSPNKVEKKDIKEAAELKLLQTAPESMSFCMGYIDTKNRLIVIDGSQALADDVLALLRSAFGSMPVVPLSSLTKVNAAKRMTDWLLKNDVPASLVCEEKIKISTLGRPKQKMTIDNIEPLSDDVTRHLSSEMQVQEIALNWSEKIAFTLTKDLVIKGVKFSGMLKDSASDDSEGGEMSDLDATFNIQRETFSEFVKSMTSWFDLKFDK